MNFILQWIDVIWLVLAVLAVKRHQIFWALGCIFACMVMMRMMAELMIGIGHPNGIMGLMSAPVHERGLAVYSFFYVVYLLLAHFSPNAHGAVFMAASITIFFAASFTYALVMVL